MYRLHHQKNKEKKSIRSPGTKICKGCLGLINIYIYTHTHSFIHLALLKSRLYILISGCNMHKDLIFSIFVANKEFKNFPIKYYYFINIYIVYQNRDFMLIKFVFFNFNVIKSYNFYIHF